MDKQKINDVLCENIVIGTLILSPAELPGVEDILASEMFYDPNMAVIFKTISQMNSNGEKIDPFTVYGHLAKKGYKIEQAFIIDLITKVVSSVTLRDDCIRLVELWKRRKMWEVGSQLMNAGYNEIGEVDSIRKEAIETLRSLTYTASSVENNFDVSKKVDHIVNDILSGKTMEIIPTGFPEIDEKGGLAPSNLVVIAAKSSEGKTSLALDFCVSATRHGFGCAIYSMEMQSSQLYARMLSSEMGGTARNILLFPMNEEELKRYEKAVGQLESLPFFYDDTASISFAKIKTSIRYMTHKKRIKLVVIDYLQILQNNERANNQTEEQFFGMVSRELKNLAKELNICIILLSQISRSNENIVEPSLSKLRGSGQIVEAADVVILIYRPELYGREYSGHFSNITTKGTAMIKIAKGRNIGTSEFICKFEKELTHFSPIFNLNDYMVNQTTSPSKNMFSNWK